LCENTQIDPIGWTNENGEKLRKEKSQKKKVGLKRNERKEAIAKKKQYN
jgi:hypothetical protein